jgi:spore maturation protein CgeB
MRASVERLIGDAAERERLGRNGLALVRRNHTFAVHVERILNVLRSVVEPARSP